MLTKRDITVAAVTAGLTMTFVFANSKVSSLDSSIFDWNDVAVKETKTGSVRTFFRSPTATLDELECHVTTLNPNESSHPPHKHQEEEVIIIKEGTLEALVNGTMKKLARVLSFFRLRIKCIPSEMSVPFPLRITFSAGTRPEQ